MKKLLASLRTQRRTDLVWLAGISGFCGGFLLGVAGVAVSMILTALGYSPHAGVAMSVFGVVTGLASMFGMFMAQAWRLKREPKLVRALGTPGRDEAAFRDVMRMGEKAVPLLLEALATPSGQMSGSGMEAWDGARAHHHAIHGLGRLKAREAVEPLVAELQRWGNEQFRAQTLRALGDIGDARAVPGIIPLLGDEKLLDYAASALKHLGEGELALAFRATLRDGECESLREHMRPEVADALMNALDSTKAMVQQSAATALANLGVIQALPRLRSKLHTSNAEVRGAYVQAIAKLETHAGLPRPVESVPVDVDTLPRATMPRDLQTDKLPREISGAQ